MFRVETPTWSTLSHTLVSVSCVQSSSPAGVEYGSRASARAALDSLDSVLQHLHVGSLSSADVEYWLSLLARVQASVACAFGEMALRAEAASLHSRSNFLSAAQQVAFVGGIDLAASHRVLETARVLVDLPQLRDDYAAGLISQTKVEAIASVAVVDPDSVADLVDLARGDTATAVVKEARRRKAAASAPKSFDDAKAKAFCRFKQRDAFGYRLSGYLTNDQIAELKPNLDAATKRVGNERHKDGSFISEAHCRAEALAGLSSSDRAAKPHVMLTCDLDAIRTGKLLPGKRCDYVGVGPISLDRVKKLLDDAHLQLAIQGLDLSTPSRQPTAAMERTLQAERDACTALGCDHSTHLDTDHNQEWQDGGKTQLSNLAKVCSGHHDLKSNHRLIWEGPRGRQTLRKLRPDERGGGPRAGPEND